MKKTIAIIVAMIAVIVLPVVYASAAVTVIDDYGSTLHEVYTASNYSRNYIISPTATIMTSNPSGGTTGPGTDNTEKYSTTKPGSTNPGGGTTNPGGGTTTPGGGTTTPGGGTTTPGGGTTTPGGRGTTTPGGHGTTRPGRTTTPGGSSTTKNVTSDTSPLSPDTAAKVNVAPVVAAALLLCVGAALVTLRKKAQAQ